MNETTDTLPPPDRPSSAPLSSTLVPNQEQFDILYHTQYCAAGGFYCGGGKDMDALVTAGLMESAGRKSFVPEEYFKITGAGRRALRDRNAAAKEWPYNDPTVPHDC